MIPAATASGGTLPLALAAHCFLSSDDHTCHDSVPAEIRSQANPTSCAHSCVNLPASSPVSSSMDRVCRTNLCHEHRVFRKESKRSLTLRQELLWSDGESDEQDPSHHKPSAACGLHEQRTLAARKPPSLSNARCSLRARTGSSICIRVL